MTYIDQINAFWNQVTFKPISCKAIGLYMALLQLFNRSRWQQTIQVSNATVTSMTELFDKQLRSARSELVKAGLIKYTAGRKGSAGVYELVDLCHEGSNTGCNVDCHMDDNKDCNEDSYSDCNKDCNKGCHMDVEETAMWTTYKDKDKDKDIEKDKDIYTPPISPQGEKKQPKPKGDRAKINEIIADQPEELQDPLREFVKMRSNIKKPLTPHALELALKKLYTMSSSPKERVDIVEQTVMNSWQGFYPLKYERQEEDVFTQVIQEAREEARYHDNAGDFTGTEAYQDSVSPQLF